MRTLILDHNRTRALELSTFFAQHGFVCKIADDPENPDIIEHYLQIGKFALAMISRKCKDAFDQAISPRTSITVRQLEDEIDSLDSEIGETEERLKHIFADIAKEHGHKKSHILQGANILLDMTSGACSINQQEVQLTPREDHVLRYLMLNRNKIVAKDELAENLYGYDFESTEALDQFIGNLREKIVAAGGDPGTIETAFGQGIVFQDPSIQAKLIVKRNPIEIFANNRIVINNEPVELKPAQQKLLTLLVKNPQTIFSKRILVENLSAITMAEEEKPDENVIKVQMHALRKIIAEATKSPDARLGLNVIETVRGVGYGWRKPEIIRSREEKVALKEREQVVKYAQGISIKCAQAYIQGMKAECRKATQIAQQEAKAQKRSEAQNLEQRNIHGLIFRWNDMEINTNAGTITNTAHAFQTTTEISPLQREALELTFINPGWTATKIDNGKALANALGYVKNKIATIGLNPDDYIKTGTRGAVSKGYRLATPAQVIEAQISHNQEQQPQLTEGLETTFYASPVLKTPL